MKNEISRGVSECIIASEFSAERICTPNEAFKVLNEEVITLIVAIGNFLIVKPEYEGGKTEFYVLKK